MKEKAKELLRTMFDGEPPCELPEQTKEITSFLTRLVDSFLSSLVDEARADERERCAKIAEEPRVMFLTKDNIEDGMLDDNHPVIKARAQMRKEIAAALRGKP